MNTFKSLEPVAEEFGLRGPEIGETLSAYRRFLFENVIDESGRRVRPRDVPYGIDPSVETTSEGDAKPLVYIAGSLRNARIPEIHKAIEGATGFDCFSGWFTAGPEADDHWKDYEKNLGFSYLEALKRPSAVNVYEFDKKWIDRADAMVLVLPAGRSGHLELGYATGKGKKAYFLLDETSGEDRWDVMYQFATAVCPDLNSLMDRLKGDLG